jgi:hypothetical protein
VTGAAARGRAKSLLRAVLAGALGLSLALLVGCGSSSKGLIPSINAGPLLGDFEEVQRAAENGGGNCSETNQAIAKTERDYAALGSSVDAALRARLKQGIENLGVKARELCLQPPSHGATTSTTTSTTTTTTPPTTTSTSTTTTTPPSEESETESEKPSPGGTPSEESKEKTPGGTEPGESGAGSKQEGSG